MVKDFKKKPFSAEHKQKHKQAMEKPEVRKKISKGLTGRKLTQDHIDNISKSMTGRKLTPEHIANISKSMKGYKWSEQALANIRYGIRNNRYTKEYGEKLSKAQLGERNNQAKLNSNQVMEIRKLYETTSHSQFSLAELFSVSRSTIQDVVLKRTWKHV